MTVKLLAKQNLESLNLTRGCIGSSESMRVKMPHCLKSRLKCVVYLFRCHDIAKKFFNQKNGDSQHTIHAMGHAHMDTGIYTVSTQYMPWDMLIWTQVYT